MRRMLIATFCLIALPALAGDGKVTITKQDCARLVRHNPSPDVAYQPGVDVHGRKVAPADLPGSGAEIKVLPDVLEFDISPKLSAFNSSLSAAKGLADTSTTLGTVRFDIAKGTFTWNGQPLGSPEQAELAEACRKMGVK